MSACAGSYQDPSPARSLRLNVHDARARTPPTRLGHRSRARAAPPRSPAGSSGPDLQRLRSRARGARAGTSTPPHSRARVRRGRGPFGPRWVAGNVSTTSCRPGSPSASAPLLLEFLRSHDQFPFSGMFHERRHSSTAIEFSNRRHDRLALGRRTRMPHDLAKLIIRNIHGGFHDSEVNRLGIRETVFRNPLPIGFWDWLRWRFMAQKQDVWALLRRSSAKCH